MRATSQDVGWDEDKFIKDDMCRNEINCNFLFQTIYVDPWLKED
jgi:hypothetical protein